MRVLTSLCLTLFVGFSAIAQQDSLFIKRMSDEIMTNGKAYDLLYELTKKIGGRLAGSPQQQQAAVWGKRNLELLGADRVFLQACKSPNWSEGARIMRRL